MIKEDSYRELWISYWSEFSDHESPVAKLFLAALAPVMIPVGYFLLLCGLSKDQVVMLSAYSGAAAMLAICTLGMNSLMNGMTTDDIYQFIYTAFWVLFTAFVVVMFVVQTKEKHVWPAIGNGFLVVIGLIVCSVRFGFIGY